MICGALVELHGKGVLFSVLLRKCSFCHIRMFFQPPLRQRRIVPTQRTATSKTIVAHSMGIGLWKHDTAKTKKGVRFAYGMVMELL